MILMETLKIINDYKTTIFEKNGDIPPLLHAKSSIPDFF